MHVVEIFLPLRRNDGSRQPRERFGKVRRTLIDCFGGLTAFARAPAEGLWESDDGDVDRDSIVIFEVMADALDRGWWAAYRAELERLFEQDEIVIRANSVDRL
jgi:hypothetical protein